MSEEYGPSLVRIAADGMVIERLVPRASNCPGRPIRQGFAVGDRREASPQSGFEAVAVSPSNRLLYVAFQSPLAPPTVADHRDARHVRLCSSTPTATRWPSPLPVRRAGDFRRDNEDREVRPDDLKVCEIAALGEHSLLVLERVRRRPRSIV